VSLSVHSDLAGYWLAEESSTKCHVLSRPLDEAGRRHSNKNVYELRTEQCHSTPLFAFELFQPLLGIEVTDLLANHKFLCQFLSFNET